MVFGFHDTRTYTKLQQNEESLISAPKKRRTLKLLLLLILVLLASCSLSFLLGVKLERHFRKPYLPNTLSEGRRLGYLSAFRWH